MYKNVRNCAVMLLGIVFLALSCHKQEYVRFCFDHFSYSILLMLLLLWCYYVYAGCCKSKDDIRKCFQLSKADVCVAILLCTVTFITVTPALRIIYDEVNLLSVSKSLAEDKTPRVVNECENLNGVQVVLYSYTDKRPLLYPFLVSIVHTCVGYRPENAFIVNGLLFISLLMIIGAALRRLVCGIGVVSALLLIVSHPIITLSATSGGFDLLSLCLLIFSFAVLYVFLSCPGETTFKMLWIMVMLLAHVRYESSLYGFIIIVLLILFRMVKLSWLGNWIYWASPLFLGPLIWQRILVHSEPQLPADEKMFSLEHFLDNNMAIVESILRLDGSLPYNVFVLLAGGLCALVLLTQCVRHNKAISSKNKMFVAIILCIVLSAWIVTTAYFWSDFRDIVCARFYMLFCVLASICLALGLIRIRCIKHNPTILLILAVFLFVSNHPIAIANRQFLERPGYSNNYRLMMQYMSVLKCKENNILVISSHPRQMAIHEFSSIGFSRANKYRREYLHKLVNKTFTDIYVIQEVNGATGLPSVRHRTVSEYKLKPVYEVPNRANHVLRISKVLPGETQ